MRASSERPGPSGRFRGPRIVGSRVSRRRIQARRLGDLRRTKGGRYPMDMTGCTHLDHVQVTELPQSVEGCEDCLATGDKWLHLRICLECGHVGCCDDSPNRHATAHAQGSGHPIIRSIQPGEEWSWCFIDQLAVMTPEVHGKPEIPPSPLG